MPFDPNRQGRIPYFGSRFRLIFEIAGRAFVTTYFSSTFLNELRCPIFRVFNSLCFRAGGVRSGIEDGFDGQRCGVFSIKNIDQQVVGKIFNPFYHSLANRLKLPEQFIFKRQIQFFVVAGFISLGIGVGHHFRPHLFANPGIFNFFEVAVIVKDGIAVIIDFQAP